MFLRVSLSSDTILCNKREPVEGASYHSVGRDKGSGALQIRSRGRRASETAEHD